MIDVTLDLSQRVHDYLLLPIPNERCLKYSLSNTWKMTAVENRPLLSLALVPGKEVKTKVSQKPTPLASWPWRASARVRTTGPTFDCLIVLTAAGTISGGRGPDWLVQDLCGSCVRIGCRRIWLRRMARAARVDFGGNRICDNVFDELPASLGGCRGRNFSCFYCFKLFHASPGSSYHFLDCQLQHHFPTELPAAWFVWVLDLSGWPSATGCPSPTSGATAMRTLTIGIGGSHRLLRIVSGCLLLVSVNASEWVASSADFVPWALPP